MRRQMLITKAIEKQAPALYATEETAVEDKQIIAKLFDPCGRWTFYLVELNPETRIAFGWTRSALEPSFDELGYVDLNEVGETRNRLGLYMERDKFYGSHTLAEVMNEEAAAL